MYAVEGFHEAIVMGGAAPNMYLQFSNSCTQPLQTGRMPERGQPYPSAQECDDALATICRYYPNDYNCQRAKEVWGWYRPIAVYFGSIGAIDVQKLKADLEACHAERTRLQAQVADLTTLTERLQQVAGEQGSLAEVRRGEILTARAEAEAAVRARDTVLGQLGSLQDRLQQLEQVQAGATTAAQQAAAELADLRARLAAAQALAEQLPGVQAQLAQFQVQAQEAMSGRETSMAELQGLRVAHDALQAQLQQAQGAASLVTGLQAELAQAKTDLVQAQQAAMAATQARDAALQQAQQAQDLASQAQAKIAEATRRAQEAEQARRGLEVQAQQAQLQVNEATEHLQTLLTALAMTQQQEALAKKRVALLPGQQAAAAPQQAGILGMPSWAVAAGLGLVGVAMFLKQQRR